MTTKERVEAKKDSELYTAILLIVKKLRLEDSDGDSYDHRSIATELERLFNTRPPVAGEVEE